MEVIQSNNISSLPSIIFLNSIAFDEETWQSYCQCFNLVFDKSYNKSYFLQKYQTTVLGYSFHGLLIDEVKRVNGGVTIIPFLYSFRNEEKLIGLAVDAFVHPGFRSDPFILAEMYALASSEAKKHGLYGIISVPNAIAYPYWKQFVGWQDIGELSYYALPLNIEKFLNIPKTLVLMANFILRSWSKLTAYFCYPKHREINLLKNSLFLQQRIYNWHQVINYEEITIILRTQDEEGIKTTYILGCFDLQMNWSAYAYRKAINFIISRIQPDIILFIGNMPFKQVSLFKVPRKKIPKSLPLTFDFLEKRTIDCSEYLNLKNWDFSLINYDVR